MRLPEIVIRAAIESDAQGIKELIRDARLNPSDLAWRRFMVATQSGTVVACAQVRVHRAGARELASVAVVSAHQRRGLGRTIAEATIAREPVRPLFLYTESRTVGFWAKLGFRPVVGAMVPHDMRVSVWVSRLAVALFSVVKRERYRIVVMRRDEP